MRTAGRLRPRGIGWACVVLAACASTAPRGAVTPATLEESIAALGIDLETFVQPLELSPEMVEWVHANVRRGASEKERLFALMDALVKREGLAVRYMRDRTGTAQEVFATGEANCLSFTNLFVALAREIDVRAYFLELPRAARYGQEGDLIVRWEHVTAGWGSGNDRTVLEFGYVPDEERYLGARKLSDLTALAMFYANRGAEALIAGDEEEASWWLETGVMLDPGWSHGWLNLGVARRRLGDLEGAEQAYRRGIERNPDLLQLYSNLATVLRMRGETDSAGELLRLLDRRSNRNPFTYLSLGDLALREERLEDARRFYRRALHLNRKHPESRAAMGLWELASDRPDRAQAWLERAERLEGGAERVELLRARLSAAGKVLAPSGDPEQEQEPETLEGRSFR